MGFENIIYGFIQCISGIPQYVLKVGYTEDLLDIRKKSLNYELPVEYNREGVKMNYLVFRIDVGRNSKQVEKIIHSLMKKLPLDSGIQYHNKKKKEYYIGCDTKELFTSMIKPVILKAKKAYFSKPKINPDTQWEEHYYLENFDKIHEDEVPTDIESEYESESETESEYEPERESETESEYEPERESETESEYEPESESETESEYEPESESETERLTFYKRKSYTDTTNSKSKRAKW